MKITKRDVYSVLGIYIGIGVLWVLCELIFVGERIPRLRDDFIAIGASIGLYGLYKFVIGRKKKVENRVDVDGA